MIYIGNITPKYHAVDCSSADVGNLPVQQYTHLYNIVIILTCMDMLAILLQSENTFTSAYLNMEIDR